MKTLFAALIVLAFAALAAAQTPDWVTGKSSNYPDDQYITGVGSGDSRQEAENQARAHIAEVFRVQLNARFTSNKSETLHGTGGSGESTDITRSSVNAGITKSLEGSEIADVWQDPQSMEYYALAVLDRQKASARISDEIASLDTELVIVGNEIDTAVTKLGKLRLLSSQKSLALKRQDLNSDYSILSSSGQGLALPGISVDQARDALAEFCQTGVVFKLISNGDGSESAAQVVSDALTAQGLAINGSGSSRSDFTINIVSKLDPSDTPMAGWYYCRWNVQLNVVGNSTGMVMTQVSKSGRSGQLTVARSKDRAVYDMDKEVGRLTGELMDGLLGEKGTR